MDVNNFNGLQNRRIEISKIDDKKIDNSSKYNPSLNVQKNDEISLGATYFDDVKEIKKELEKTRSEQGFFGKVWDNFKNITHIGAGSNKVDDAIKKFQKGEITKEEAKDILEKYKDGQKVCLDVASDMLSSIVAVGAFAMSVPTGGMSLPLGLGLSCALGAGIKTGIKGVDAKLNHREYNAKNVLYDVVTGGVNGLLAPVTNGLGSSLTKTIGCKLGLEIVGDAAEQGVKTTLKSLIVNQSIDVAGGTLKKRALALGAGMALDGALGGAADNTARAILDGEDTKGVAKSAIQGLVGGLIMAPVMGGSMRLAGKMGKKLGQKIFKNAPEIDTKTQSGGIKKDMPAASSNEGNISSVKINEPEQPVFRGTSKSNAADSIIEVSDIDTNINNAETEITQGVTESSKTKAPNKTEAKAPQAETGENKPKIKITSDLSDDVIDDLLKSVDNIPKDEKAREAFIEKFLMTDLKTGEQIQIKPDDWYTRSEISAYAEQLIEKGASDDDVKVMLEHSVRMSQLLNRNTPDALGASGSVIGNPEWYRTAQDRNIYGLFEEMKMASPDKSIAPIDMCIEKLAQMSDADYKKSVDLIRKIGMDKSVYSSKIADFAQLTSDDTIRYMLEHDLFNTSNMDLFYSKSDLLEAFASCSKDTVEAMDKRGLLTINSERTKGRFNFQSVKELTENISDEEWKNVQERGLLQIKTKSKFSGNQENMLDSNIICELAKMKDETYSKVIERGLYDKVYDNHINLLPLAELDDAGWQKLVDRNIDISEHYFYEKDSLKKLISIPDEKWQIATQRGLDFVKQSDYKLLELTDEEWANLVKRKLNTLDKFGHIDIYDVDSQIKLSKLSDEDFERAVERKLIKERNYSVRVSFDEEGEFALGLSGDDFSIYSGRKIDEIDASLDIKRDLINMTDEQYQRITEDIIPAEKQRIGARSYKKANIESDIYKLAYLDSEKYEVARNFIGIESFGEKQFSADDILKIIDFEPEKLEKLQQLIGNNKKYRLNKDTVLNLIELDASVYDKTVGIFDTLASWQINKFSKMGILSEIPDSPKFIENRELISKVNSERMSSNAKDILVEKLLGLKKQDYSTMTLKEKMKLINAMQEAQSSSILSSEEKISVSLEKEIMELQQTIKQVISPTQTSSEDIKVMMKGFFANNNPKLDSTLSGANFAKYGESGLPLTYSRNSFIQDLNSAMKNVAADEQEGIIKKLGITLIKDSDDIVGYDGIIDLTRLSGEGQEGEILSLATKFIKENSVNTGNKEFDDAMNSLIQGMPEFINVIGKAQHKTHDFTLDIHILSVLKEVMANPDYKKLQNDEKFCLKFAAILHDIAKLGGVIDDEHPELCALYARDILNKDSIKMPESFKDRIYELVKNHHWLAEYNTRKAKPDEIAVMFRRSGDLKMAQIMAEADLKGVKADGSFYEKYKSALDIEKQQPIQEVIDEINSKGQMLFTSKVIDRRKLPIVEHNGQKYQVVDFTKIPSGEDLTRIGFEPGTTPESLRLNIHMVSDDKIGNLENVLHLSDPSNQGFLCVSPILLNDKNTYAGFRYGLSLESESANIANASSKNQGSGRGKDFSKFHDILTGKGRYSKGEAYRDDIPKMIKKTLNLSDDEYAKLYKIIQKYKYLSQIDNLGEIKVGNKTFSGEEIKKAITEADNLLIRANRSSHNEANLFAPKTNAVVAKVNSFEEVPQQLLDFAQKHNLPIYILGK